MTVPIPRTQPADPVAIQQVRNALGADIPSDYVTFLGDHNGAEPESNALIIPGRNVVNIRSFIPAEDIPTIKSEIDGFPESAVPVADDDVGNYFYIDRGRSGIFFWDHENEGPDVKVADSFNALLEKLEPFEQEAVDLDPEDIESVWIDPAFRPEG